MYLVTLGVNHERAPVELRERLAFDADTLASGVRRLASLTSEAAILSTCNRVEFYAVCSDADVGLADLRGLLTAVGGLPTSALDGVARAAREDDAVRHLFRVAAGLDSLLLGEPQILRQVGRAWEASRQLGAAGPLLNRLFLDALRVGKRARAHTGVARNRASIPHAAVDRAAEELGGLAGCVALIIGAGEIATLTALVLRNARVGELLVANRTPTRAEALAARVGGQPLPLPLPPGALDGVDALFAATAAPGRLLGPGDLAIGRTRPLVALDLGVPRNIDPALGAHPVVRLFGVDDLADTANALRAGHAREAERAEALVEAAVNEFGAWRRSRAVVPTIVALRARAEAVRATALEQALRKLGRLSDRDREVVTALSHALVNTLLHEPLVRLKTDAAAVTTEDATLAHATERLFSLEAPDAANVPAARRTGTCSYAERL